MSALSFSFRRAFAASMALAAWLSAGVLVVGAPPAAAREAAREFDFSVTWSLFPNLTLANGSFRLVNEPGRYALVMEARARLAAPSIDWRGTLLTEGTRTRRSRTPERFERSSIRPDASEIVIVRWPEDGGEPQTEILRRPAAVSVARDPVDPSAIADVIDPLTFLISMLDVVERSSGESCDLSAKTWDGQRLAEIRTVTLDTLRNARVDCRIIYNSIQGLRRDTPWRVQEDTTMRVARFENEGGVWVPKTIVIEAEVIGIDSTFTTTITPAAR